jgi:hypothetical protein
MFKHGDLIRWFLMYSAGVVKESGTGIIIDINKINNKNWHSTRYKVLRSEQSDIMMFEQHEIEKFEGEKNEL